MPCGRHGKGFHQGPTDAVSEQFEEVAEAADAEVADREQALFGVGMSAVFARPFTQPEKARAAFQAIVDEFPESRLVPWALIELGNLEFERHADFDYEAPLDINEVSHRYYRKVIEEHRDSVALHEAVSRLANSYFFEIEPEYAMEGVKILEGHLQEYPDNPLISGMYFMLTKWYHTVHQDYRKSIQFAVRLGEAQLSNPWRWSFVYWHVAQTYRRGLKEVGASIPWYEKIITVTPKSHHVLMAKQVLDRLGVDWRQLQTSSEQSGKSGESTSRM